MDCDVEGYICGWSAPIGYVMMNLRDGRFVTDITCLAMGAIDSAAIMSAQRHWLASFAYRCTVR